MLAEFKMDKHGERKSDPVPRCLGGKRLAPNALALSVLRNVSILCVHGTGDDEPKRRLARPPLRLSLQQFARLDAEHLRDALKGFNRQIGAPTLLNITPNLRACELGASRCFDLCDVERLAKTPDLVRIE